MALLHCYLLPEILNLVPEVYINIDIFNKLSKMTFGDSCKIKNNSICEINNFNNCKNFKLNFKKNFKLLHAKKINLDKYEPDVYYEYFKQENKFNSNEYLLFHFSVLFGNIRLIKCIFNFGEKLYPEVFLHSYLRFYDVNLNDISETNIAKRYIKQLMYLSCKYNKINIIEWLLSFSIPLTDRDLILILSECTSPKIVELLTKNKYLELCDCFINACKKSNLSFVQYLVRNKYIYIKEEYIAYSGITGACAGGKLKIVKWLLHNVTGGIDNIDGTALLRTYMKGRINVFKYLIKHYACALYLALRTYINYELNWNYYGHKKKLTRKKQNKLKKLMVGKISQENIKLIREEWNNDGADIQKRVNEILRELSY